MCLAPLMRWCPLQSVGDSRFLTADLSIDCSSSRYATGAAWAAVMLLLLPVGLPCFYLWQLHSLKDLIATREQLMYVRGEDGHVLLDAAAEPVADEAMTAHRDAALGPLLFVFWPYRPECWYWEVVDMLRKVLLCGWLVVFRHSTTVQAVLGVLSCLLGIKVLGVGAPWRDGGAAVTAECASWQVLALFFIALLLRDQDFSAARGPDLDAALLSVVLLGVLVEAWLAIVGASARDSGDKYMSTSAAHGADLAGSDKRGKTVRFEEQARAASSSLAAGPAKVHPITIDNSSFVSQELRQPQKLLQQAQVPVEKQEEQPDMSPLEESSVPLFEEDEEDDDDENVLMC